MTVQRISTTSPSTLMPWRTRFTPAIAAPARCTCEPIAERLGIPSLASSRPLARPSWPSTWSRSPRIRPEGAVNYDPAHRHPGTTRNTARPIFSVHCFACPDCRAAGAVDHQLYAIARSLGLGQYPDGRRGGGECGQVDPPAVARGPGESSRERHRIAGAAAAQAAAEAAGQSAGQGYRAEEPGCRDAPARADVDAALSAQAAGAQSGF